MNKFSLITIIVSMSVMLGVFYYIIVTFDITRTFNVEMILFISKRVLIGVSIATQVILCIIISSMIILQKSDDGVFKRSLNPLMYKADNVALHNNTKWFIIAIAINSLLIQLIW